MTVSLVGSVPGGHEDPDDDPDDAWRGDWLGDEWPELPDDDGRARLDLAPAEDLAADQDLTDQDFTDQDFTDQDLTDQDLTDQDLDTAEAGEGGADDQQALLDLAPEADLPDRTDQPDRDQQIAQLRRRLAAVPAAGALAGETGSRTAAPTADPEDDQVLAVPAPLRLLLPRGGLVRGSVVALSGSSSLLTGLVAAVTAAGGWAGVVGRPELGVLAAAEMGADLRRVALVPRPGSDPVDVAAVLLDGMDLVVLDLAGLDVAPSRARAVVARARHRGAVLAVTGGTWPGAELELHAEATGHLGLGWGHGRVVGRELAVRVRGRGQASRERRGQVLVRADAHGVRWSPVEPVTTAAGLARTGT